MTIRYTTLEYGYKRILSTYSSKRDEMERLAIVENAKLILNNTSALKKKLRRFYVNQTTRDNYELDQSKIDDTLKYDVF